MTDKQIQQIVNAISRISHGDVTGPTGLESVSIAIAGEHLNMPLSESLNNIADAINKLADAVSDLKEKGN